MAATTKVIDVRRPLVSAIDANGNTACVEPAAFLEVTFDRYSNGLQVQTVAIALADYFGLAEEWADGTTTEVLEFAVLAALEAMAWQPARMTSAQRAYIETAMAMGD
jgi:hypothetical protein